MLQEEKLKRKAMKDSISEGLTNISILPKKVWETTNSKIFLSVNGPRIIEDEEECLDLCRKFCDELSLLSERKSIRIIVSDEMGFSRLLREVISEYDKLKSRVVLFKNDSKNRGNPLASGVHISSKNKHWNHICFIAEKEIEPSFGDIQSLLSIDGYRFSCVSIEKKESISKGRANSIADKLMGRGSFGF